MTLAPEATRPKALLAFRQSVVRFDATKMSPWLGARNALGMALHSLPAGVGAAR